jgi:RNA polymerase sigma-70 factor, ECF subfamily
MNDQTGLDIIAAAHAGDPKALEALVEQQQARVYRFSMKMCGDEEDAKDVLQETLLAMVRNIGRYRRAAPLPTWLYSIARSFCIKKRRRSKFAPDGNRIVELSGAENVADAKRGPDEALAGRQLAATLDHAIAELPPPYREVLVLRDIEGLSASEAAKVLGVRVAAVKSRLHRARAAVRGRIAPLLDRESGGASIVPGRSCPDILRLYSKHLEGEVDAALCARMERHLATCGHCRASCDALRRTLALCRAVPEPAVPPEVQAAVRREVRACLRQQ